LYSTSFDPRPNLRRRMSPVSSSDPRGRCGYGAATPRRLVREPGTCEGDPAGTRRVQRATSLRSRIAPRRKSSILIHPRGTDGPAVPLVDAHRRMEKPAGPKIVVDCGLWSPQPNATSSTIITAKPTIADIVARSVLPPRCDSGTTSSTTTNIIAPAANARAYGRRGLA
jgi:hypothetical protein